MNIESAKAALELVLDTVEYPQASCSCHINPPCADCVDNSGTREMLDAVRSALESKPVCGFTIDGKTVYIYHFFEYESNLDLWSYQKVTKEEIENVLNKYKADYAAQVKLADENDAKFERKEITPEQYQAFWADFKWAMWQDYLKEFLGMEKFSYEAETCTNGL